MNCSTTDCGSLSKQQGTDNKSCNSIMDCQHKCCTIDQTESTGVISCLRYRQSPVNNTLVRRKKYNNVKCIPNSTNSYQPEYKYCSEICFSNSSDDDETRTCDSFAHCPINTTPKNKDSKCCLDNVLIEGGVCESCIDVCCEKAANVTSIDIKRENCKETCFKMYGGEKLAKCTSLCIQATSDDALCMGTCMLSSDAEHAKECTNECKIPAEVDREDTSPSNILLIMGFLFFIIIIGIVIYFV